MSKKKCCKEEMCDEDQECCVGSCENTCDDNCYDDYDDENCCGSFEERAYVWEVAPMFYGTAYQKGKFIDIDSLNYLWNSWVVLFFYPADFTFVCPIELEELQEKYAKLKKMGVEVISVSTDTHFTHMGRAMQSKTIAKIEYPMLSDANWVISSSYGVFQENWLAQRWTFIIDPDWVLQSLEISAEWLGRSADELVRRLEALQYMRANPGVVCPNKWKEKWTLKPGEKLVWKI